MWDNNQVSVTPELDEAACFTKIIDVCIFLSVSKLSSDHGWVLCTYLTAHAHTYSSWFPVVSASHGIFSKMGTSIVGGSRENPVPSLKSLQ